MQARILDGTTIKRTTELSEIRAAIQAEKPTWIELESKTEDADTLLSDVLHIHPLTVEDIWAESSSPKVDAFDDYTYVIVHGLQAASSVHDLSLVELDVVLGKNFLITHDSSQWVAKDLQAELDRNPRLMVRGLPWVMHALLDRSVDRYMPLVDQLDTEIEQLESEVLAKAGTPSGGKVLARILSFKRTLQSMRRMAIHQRETLLRLARGEIDAIPKEALPFFRDVYDHFLRIGDTVDGYRDLVTSALDAYLSVQSNRMNEIMKTLTLMSTVMMPLTFIAGVYGMNFKTMPELEWRYGYPYALALMATVALGILLWFRRKGWVRNGRS
jgi:magnesium transporter